MSIKLVLSSLTLVIAATTVHAGNSDFKFSTNEAGFVFDNNWYKGDVTKNGIHYKPGLGLDLTTLSPGTYQAQDGIIFSPKIYKIYRQNYSTVVGNITAGSADRSFVKDVVGQNTALSTLPTSGTYTYTGKSFSHLSDGDFAYSINLNNKTGSGSFSNLKYAFPQGTAIASGTLNSAALTVTNGVLGVQGGTANVTTNTPSVNTDLAGFTFNYDLGVFGPNAEEVAGRVYGTGNYSGTNYDLGIGVAGKR